MARPKTAELTARELEKGKGQAKKEKGPAIQTLSPPDPPSAIGQYFSVNQVTSTFPQPVILCLILARCLSFRSLFVFGPFVFPCVLLSISLAAPYFFLRGNSLTSGGDYYITKFGCLEIALFSDAYPWHALKPPN